MTTLSVENVNNLVGVPNFKAKKNRPELVKIEGEQDYEIIHYQTDASTGKKWGVGIASAFIPGLGQAINGDWRKGFAFFGADIAAEILTALAAVKKKISLSAAGYIGVLGMRIWGIVDAVKGAKSEGGQIVPSQTKDKVNISV